MQTIRRPGGNISFPVQNLSPLEGRILCSAAHDVGAKLSLPEHGSYGLSAAPRAILQAAIASASPLTDLPLLHSRPTATAKLFLDLDGDPPTASWGGYPVSATPAYHTDGDASTFSVAELAAVREIWARVSEKYAPFDIDVTTEAPPALTNKVAFRIVIGGDGAWFGGSSGVTWFNSFSDFHPNTGYVFAKNLANGTVTYVAEAAAHEAGHGFGLQHQSTYSGSTLTAEYNPGNGLVAPLMGNSYYAARGIWWTGPNNLGATTTQDDLAVLTGTTNGFGYAADDFGSSTAAAATVTVTGGSVAVSGIIEQASDLDYFKFTATAGGQASFTADVGSYVRAETGASAGATLDLALELRDSSGSLIASADTASLGETISANLPAAGDYYLVVRSHGSYGDLGTYVLSGTVPTVSGGPTANAGGPYAVAEGGSVALSAADSSGSALTYAWDLDDDGVFGETGAGATRGVETGVSPTFGASTLDGPTSATVWLLVTDASGNTSTASATVSVANAAPTVAPTGNSSVAEGATYTLGFSATDPGGDAISTWVINWGDGTTPTTAGTGASSATHTYADNGTYTLSVTATDDDGGAGTSTATITVTDSVDPDPDPDLTPPTATLATLATPVATATRYIFAVTYADAVGLDPTSPGATDVRVTGPGGFDQVARFLSASTADGGKSYLAYYAITPPGGAWSYKGNGSYTFAVQPGAVTDTSGNAVTAGAIGTLSVRLPIPDLAGNTLADAAYAGIVGAGYDQSYDDFVSKGDRNDYYRIRVKAATDVTIKLSGMTDDANVQLLDGNGAVVQTSNRAGTRTEYIVRTLAPGYYYLRAYYEGAASTAYGLRVTAGAVAATAPGSADTVGNTLATAAYVGIVGSGYARLYREALTSAGTDAADVYRLRIKSPTTVTAGLHDLIDNAQLALLDGDGRVLARSTRAGTKRESVSLPLAAGNYYLRVFSDSPVATPYSLDVFGGTGD
ncbi:MAG TPA: pre-peptidase C-terminal domain-containing protein [Tepidisphaeraceae bacterium]|nr:pre-peptidase C-terminal domain-containing protein [Tepidisphaeraceae bacterium]